MLRMHAFDELGTTTKFILTLNTDDILHQGER